MAASSQPVNKAMPPSGAAAVLVPSSAAEARLPLNKAIPDSNAIREARASRVSRPAITITASACAKAKLAASASRCLSCGSAAWLA